MTFEEKEQRAKELTVTELMTSFYHAIKNAKPTDEDFFILHSEIVRRLNK